MTRIMICGDYGNTANYRKAFEKLGVTLEYGDYTSDIENFDGLLLPGGCDVDPSYYNEENNGSEYIDKALDEKQFKTLDKFVKKEKPVFGICRGHQLINVYFGGSLIQDVGELNKTHRCLYWNSPTDFKDNINTVNVKKDSVLCRLYGKQFVSNSSHHQAVKEPGKGLVVTSVSDDGLVEGLEHESLPVITVQFHPERMCFDFASETLADGSRIIEYFIEMCRNKQK